MAKPKHWTRRFAEGVYKNRHKIAAVWRYGRSKSRSKTLVNEKVEKMKGDDIHSGITDASYTVKCKGNKATGVHWKGASYKYFEYGSAVHSGLAGIQNVVNLMALCTTSQQIVSSGTAYQVGALPMRGSASLISVNPYQKSTGSSILSASTRYASERLYVSRASCKFSITNVENAACSVWIYAFEAVKNGALDPATCWLQANGAQGNQMIVAAAQTAAGATTGGTLGFMGSTTGDFFSPMHNRMFRNAWKTLKVHRVNLAGGASEDVNFHVKLNYMLDVNKLITSNGNLTYDPVNWVDGNISTPYPRGCVVFLAVVRGQPVIDTKVNNTSVATYSTNKIAVVMEKQYTMHPVFENSGRLDVRVGLPQLNTGDGLPGNLEIGKQAFMDVVDAATTVEQA